MRDRMGEVRRFRVVLALTLAAILTSPLLGATARAESGTFFLGSTTMSKRIWFSSAPRDVFVTVTVTGAPGDSYADSEGVSVTVQTDNFAVTLYNGESRTIDDPSATEVWLYENPGSDHNGYSYYGIEGDWEVTVAGGGGGPGDTSGGAPSWVWIVLVAVVLAAVAIGAMLSVGRMRARGYPLTAPPPPTVMQAPAAAVGCPNCGTPSAPGSAFCARCGARLR